MKFQLLTFSLIGLLLTGCKTDKTIQDATELQKSIEKVRVVIQEQKQASANNTTPHQNPTTVPANTKQWLPKDCDEHFVQGVRPQGAVKVNIEEICHKDFSVMYSGVAKVPVWAAEHLTRDRIMKAKKLPRIDNFHEETRLPFNKRALLSDYSQTGYDRGHLAPNADMANTNAQYNSFSLSNIAPQAPELNRGGWSNTESKVRYQTLKEGESFVLTGLLFKGANIKLLKQHVMVPTHFYKAVYYPVSNTTTVFLAENSNSNNVDEMSVARFIEKTGIDPFPTLPNSIKK